MSAVSMKLKSTARNPSRILNDVASSIVQPKTFPPRQSGRTSIPEFPNLRRSGMASLPDWIVHAMEDFGDGRSGTASANGRGSSFSGALAPLFLQGHEPEINLID